jgi:SAM-dependent methyltransferase
MPPCVVSNNEQEAPTSWVPPSDTLELQGGVWRARQISTISYPESGNDMCFQLEDQSYWFGHRNNCIREVVRQFAPDGDIYDLGGGNGFVAAGLQQDGHEVVVVEPGPGMFNASKRGIRHVIGTTLQDAGFRPLSLPAAAAFDVVEHIQDEVSFLSDIHTLLRPGGRFYCSVPAFNALWSDEDVNVGHFRRHSRRTLTEALRQSGFMVEFMTYFFAWLIVPVFLVRSVPFRLLGDRRARKKDVLESMKSDHSLPAPCSSTIGRLHAWELQRLREGGTIPFGTSLLCVARKPHASASHSC